MELRDPSIALQIRNRVLRFGIRERYPKKGRGKGEVNWKFRERNFVVIERSSRSRANESSRAMDEFRHASSPLRKNEAFSRWRGKRRSCGRPVRAAREIRQRHVNLAAAVSTLIDLDKTRTMAARRGQNLTLSRQ